MNKPPPCAAMLLGLIASSSLAAPIVIDGSFEDWKDHPPVLVDAADDQDTGVFDLTEVHAIGFGSELFLSFDINAEVNLISGDPSDGSLSLLISKEGGNPLVIDFRNRRFSIQNALGLSATTWNAFGYRAAPTYASERVEIRLDLAELGVKASDSVEISFAGTDDVEKPATVTMGESAPSQWKPAALTRSESVEMRIASLNTLRGGLTDSSRVEQFGRLIKSSQADTFVFQEEDNSSEQVIAAVIGDATGTSASDWSVIRATRSCVIATKHALEPARTFNNRYTAAILTDQKDRKSLVICVHFKCCGYAQSGEDRQRVMQANEVMQTIRRVHLEHGKDLPVVVIGDWNLVGSREPLDVILEEGFERVMPRNAATGETYTWFNPDSAFPPGQLDLIAASGGIRSTGAWSVDTRTMPKEVLDAASLKKHDSASTDHLMLIADFVYTD
ncbi:MAG: endonuclease/exonuclease/phosphatase family protein [Planctomycetota bacterium]